MKNELEEMLIKKYPKLFAETKLPASQSCMAFGIECSDGWFPIINSMCGLIQNHITQTRKNIASIRKFNRILRQAIGGNSTNLKYYFKNHLGYNDQQIEERLKKDLEAKNFRTEYGKPPTQLVFTQIKEKFGTLRVYSAGGDEFCSGVISMAEAMSSVTCEECSMPGEVRNDSWIVTLCDTCAQQRIRKPSVGK
jgi:hypothetical protein